MSDFNSAEATLLAYWLDAQDEGRPSNFARAAASQLRAAVAKIERQREYIDATAGNYNAEVVIGGLVADKQRLAAEVERLMGGPACSPICCVARREWFQRYHAAIKERSRLDSRASNVIAMIDEARANGTLLDRISAIKAALAKKETL